jgi:hypothetical protein
VFSGLNSRSFRSFQGGKKMYCAKTESTNLSIDSQKGL